MNIDVLAFATRIDRLELLFFRTSLADYQIAYQKLAGTLPFCQQIPLGLDEPEKEASPAEPNHDVI